MFKKTVLFVVKIIKLIFLNMDMAGFRFATNYYGQTEYEFVCMISYFETKAQVNFEMRRPDHIYLYVSATT